MPVPGDVMVGGRPRSGSRLGYAAGAVALVIVTLAVVGRSVEGQSDPAATPPVNVESAEEIASAFVEAWANQDWEYLQELTLDQSLDAAGQHELAHRVLRVERMTAALGDPRRDGDQVRVPVRVTWTLQGLSDHSFTSTVTAAQAPDGQWRVRWWYPTLHPDLTPERRFERVRQFRERAPILARDGEPLAWTVSTKTVEAHPSRVTDPAAVAAALDAAGVIDEASVLEALDSTDPEAGFVTLAEVDAEPFGEVRTELEELDGLRFRPSFRRELADDALAPVLVGRVGAITAEGLEELGDPYDTTDMVGRSGLERAFERQLAGAPQQEARLVEGDQLVTSLAFREGAHPQPVQTTLDLRVQRAAQEALSGVDNPAAMVVLDAATGEVLASASVPEGEFNRGLEGRYPPGSTFKIVTAAAALAEGWQPDDQVDCPPTTRIGGREVRNAGGDGPGAITFADAFTRSCNTAFALLAHDLGADALTAAAERFGFGVSYELGIPAFGSDFPEPADDAELAAAGIGQARVEASAAHLASVTAAVASGAWRPPQLISAHPTGEDHVPDDEGAPEHEASPGDEDAPENEGSSEDEPIPAQERSSQEHVLEAQVRASLATLMEQAVEQGTGQAAARPGEPVAGKTGSAQFGSGDPLPTHAWFAGFRGDLAFAVVVEGGGAGGSVAAPLAGRLLELLE